MYQNDAMKVLTGEVRLSYANLTTPRAAQQGGEPKYSVTLLIPKSDAATKADIDAAIQAAANDAMAKVWNGARPPMLKVPIYDGDGVRPSGVPFGDECKGHWVMTASTKNKPQVVGIDNINCELSPADIYSGMYGRVTVRFFGYSNSGNKGIGCGLGNVLKTRDGEPLSGQASAASDFAGLGGTPAATPTYGAAMPATPGAYGVQPAAPAAPAAQVPWATHKLDIEGQRVAGMTDKREALRQAVYLILNVERYAYPIYSRNYGSELVDLIGQPMDYAMSEMKRRITDALMQDDRITGVDDWTFETGRKSVLVRFTVYTIYGELEATKEVEI